MDRVWNFSAGPSVLPIPVLEQAQRDLVCYPGAGSSVMEMSHRSRPFEDILAGAEQSLRRLLQIKDNYSVLFLQGGASLQFSAIPMNLAHQGDTFDYALTGQFATKAFEEGQRWGNAVAVASSADKNYSYIPALSRDMLSPNARYLHITVNNTIFGTQYNELPDTGDVPLVGDISSIIAGKAYDIDRFGLLYAGAQKNLGPAGLTVVIVRKDLLDFPVDSSVPTMLKYKPMAKNDSMYNTPPCFAIYTAGLVFEWMEKEGGVAEMERRNTEKSKLLYDVIDNSSIFTNAIRPCDRSIMNVTFALPNDQMTDDFLKLCKSRSIINIKGHRSAGGFRASMYNAMPLEGTKALIDCIKDFEAQSK